jgi:hypothetical protein
VRAPGEATALDLIETAFDLLRAQPLLTVAPHLIGSAPFLAGMLAFLFEMSTGVFAVERLLPWSFALTLLWIWMTFWHTVYCRRLVSKFAHEPSVQWNSSRLFRSAIIQTAVQGFKPIVVPAAFLIGLPLAWTFAFFQSAAIYASATDASLSTTWTRSREAASVWQKQSWILLCILILLAAVVFINIAIGAFVAAQLARSLLGVTALVFGTPSAFFNTTLLSFVAAATYICVDPVLKAAYVARSFAFESTRTGADIRITLQRLAQIAAIAIACVVCAPASAQPHPVRVDELDRAIDGALRQPEYSWRMPRETARHSVNSPLDRAADAIAAGFRKAGEAIGSAIEWLLDLFIDREIDMPGGGVRASAGRRVRIAMLVVCALLAVVLLIVGWRLRRKTPSVRATPQTASAVVSIDLKNENVSAAQLEHDEWLRLAHELLAKGETRLAARAVFLSALSRLQRDGLITVERFKTNLDYDRELGRRARAFPQVRPAFQRLLGAFEPCWYGNVAADPVVLTEMQSLLNELKAHA